MDGNLENQVGTTSGSNQGNTVGNTVGNNQGIQANVTPTFCDLVRYHFNVTQPDNTDGHLTASQQANQLEPYMRYAVEYIKEVEERGFLRHRPTRVTDISLNDNNISFLKQVISQNPNSTAYRQLAGRSESMNCISQVNITNPLYTMLRNVR